MGKHGVELPVSCGQTGHARRASITITVAKDPDSGPIAHCGDAQLGPGAGRHLQPRQRTTTRGTQDAKAVFLNSGTSDELGFAPAAEFSWTPNLGVLFGVRIITQGHNTAASVTPAVGINYVL